MLFCDACDRGYHTFCVGLKSPPKGRWTCELCSVCASCGTDSSGGKKWRHEYTKGNGSGNGAVVFLQVRCRSTLCPSRPRRMRRDFRPIFIAFKKRRAPRAHY